MKGSHSKLCSTVLVSSCVFLYLLLCINQTSLFGFEFRTIHQVNNYAISINTQTPEPLHPTPEPKTLTQNENRANPATKRPAKARKPVSCSRRYIYVHDLPTKFNDDLIRDCRKLIKWFDMCPYMVNSGLGPEITDDTEKRVLTDTGYWFNTNQFLLEVIFRERMKDYDCLTNDSSMASAIYVPFYTGFDISRHLWGFNLTIRDKLGFELANWLAGRSEWGKLKGRDHFFVAGRIGWDFRRDSDKESGWGNKLMRLPEFANATMLSIETTNWGNEFSIPYPTYFHPSTKSQILNWQKLMRNRKRNNLFAFAGAKRPSRNDSIRTELINQCVSSSRCGFMDCKPPGSNCENPVKIMEFFQDSVFCLQPRGDSATRRSIFDSVLAGCIPVFFHPGTAYTQYTWYFPRNYTEYSVYIPEKDVKNQNADIGEILARVSEKEVTEMREEVLNLIPKIVYRKPGTKSDVFEDAFDVAISRVLERVRRVERDFKEGKDPAIYFSKLKDLNRLG